MSAVNRLTQQLRLLTASAPLSAVNTAGKAPFKVAVVGSGNWGTTVAKIVAENCTAHPELFEPEVRVWVREEKVNGKNLTDIFNSEHENVRYLPKIKLPHNLIAEPDLLKAVEGANIIVFNLPHQFLAGVCKQLKGKVNPKARAISCLKGLEVTPQGVYLLSDVIENETGLHCGVLSGANLATEIALEKYSETTVAYNRPKDFFGEGDVTNDVLKALFHRPYFHVRCVQDVAGVSIGGALKNVVALCAGFVEGKNWGDNAKAAIMRRGMLEMINFSKRFFPETDINTLTVESAGVADLITSCAGGRNFKVGRAFGKESGSGKTIQDIEKELLNGQSAQGVITCNEVHELLKNKNMQKDFPLFETTWGILHGEIKIEDLPEILYHAN
ncbi:Glycerol-3-phosphate dehydrogenase [NAD(+)] 1 [Yarrowia sp. C11]|nr:Glycerol-3-phosphate dehydrogenase [NAD(+)] 1 [Yarrowia sp. C11]KAG5363995.1 Glycerol-3-phosphate dehydrogenase [NAD(+)] 1 [Yarrowia sp. E02]